MKGAGKSVAIKKLVKVCRRRLILDTERTWRAGSGDRVIEGCRELLDVARRCRLGDPAVPFSIVYRELDNQIMATAGCGLAYVLRNVTLVIDELAWLCTARYMPARLSWIPQFGRDRCINLVGTTREPGEIHNLLLSQADYRIFFHMEPGAGLDRIARQFGRDFAGEVANLRGHKSLSYGNLARLQLLGREGLDSPS